jgi:hypothetical protein
MACLFTQTRVNSRQEKWRIIAGQKPRSIAENNIPQANAVRCQRNKSDLDVMHDMLKERMGYVVSKWWNELPHSGRPPSRKQSILAPCPKGVCHEASRHFSSSSFAPLHS